MSDFLIGEGKLESYLDENPPIEANIHKAKLGLIDAKRYLNLATGEEGIRVSKISYQKRVLHSIMSFRKKQCKNV